MKDKSKDPGVNETQSDYPEPSEHMVSLYRQHMPEYIQQMVAAVEAGDDEAVYFQCHKMSSAVKIMGFDNIANLLERVQREKPSGDSLRQQCGAIEKLVGHTLTLLNKA